MHDLSRFVLLLGFVAVPGTGRAVDPPTAPADIIRAFEKAWVVPKGYMRPLDDAGWKAPHVGVPEARRDGREGGPGPDGRPGQWRAGNPRLRGSRLSA